MNVGELVEHLQEADPAWIVSINGYQDILDVEVADCQVFLTIEPSDDFTDLVDG